MTVYFIVNVSGGALQHVSESESDALAWIASHWPGRNHADDRYGYTAVTVPLDIQQVV